jgi:hypothetical protein
MKTPNWKPITVLKDEQFSYVLSFIEEDSNPKKHFINECDWTEKSYKQVSNYYWFIAEITAFKGKVEICSAYLGGNCYKKLADVLGDRTIEQLLGGYGPQMIEEVKTEASGLLEI